MLMLKRAGEGGSFLFMTIFLQQCSSARGFVPNQMDVVKRAALDEGQRGMLSFIPSYPERSMTLCAVLLKLLQVMHSFCGLNIKQVGQQHDEETRHVVCENYFVCVLLQ